MTCSILTISPALTGEGQKVIGSKKLLQQLTISTTEEITIQIGQKEIKITIEPEPLDRDTTEIIFPERLLKELNLPNWTHHLQSHYDRETRKLKLGPVIGLLTDFRAKKDGERPDFRSIHKFCEELHQSVSLSGGLFYVFAFEDFPGRGYCFQDGSWVSSQVPLPDVVYNRVHSRRLEYSRPFQKFRNRVEQLNIPFFNDRFLSKWEVYEYLIQEKQLQPFLPETKLFTSDSLKELTESNDIMFLKPVHGSQGRNIIKIEKNPDGNFTFCSSDQPLSIRPSLREELDRQLKALVGNRIYIIQEGITLMTHNECPLDFRALCHKSGPERWEVTSLLARISAENEFVSNLARGGTLIRPTQVLRTQMSKKEALQTVSIIKELAVETSAAISKHAPGMTGELGIDIGIDNERKPWLIEVNFKPSKNFEDGQVKIRPSAKAIVRFCTALFFDTSES